MCFIAQMRLESVTNGTIVKLHFIIEFSLAIISQLLQ